MYDLERVAELEGIPLDEAIDLYSWHDDFNVLARDLAERYADSFSYASVVDNQPQLGFKASIPKGAGRVVAELPVKPVIDGDTGWSEAELVLAGEQVHFSLVEQLGGAQVLTDIDTQEGTVDVVLPEDALLRTRSSLDVLVEDVSIADTFSEFPASVAVTVTIGDTDSGTETVYGGGHLRTCTAAFSVCNSSYSNGVMTAEHCNNSQTYAGRSVLTTFRSAMSKAQGDVQWHSSSETAGALFYYKSGSLRQRTKTAHASAGTKVCVYGKATNDSCDEVYKTNQCSGNYCKLTMTHRHKTDQGDSGGPWLFGNTGYGVHHGYKTYLLIQRSLFTPVRHAATQLGVTVKLS